MSNFVRASSIHPSTSVLGRFPVIGCLGVVGDGVCVPLPGESLLSGGAEVLSVGGAGDALDAPPTAPFPPFADAPPTAPFPPFADAPPTAPFPPFAAGAAAAAGGAGAAAASARAMRLELRVGGGRAMSRACSKRNDMTRGRARHKNHRKGGRRCST